MTEVKTRAKDKSKVQASPSLLGTPPRFSSARERVRESKRWGRERSPDRDRERRHTFLSRGTIMKLPRKF